MFTGLNPGIVASPGTVLSSGINFSLADARLIEFVMTIGTPIVGAPTLQVKFQSTPNSPFVFIDIPEGTGAARVATSGLFIARIDAEFVPSGHTFVRVSVALVGAGSFPFHGYWHCHDLQREAPPKAYDAFPSLQPVELTIVDTTLLGNND